MPESKKLGYIYVLTNESFHRANWIKIGYAENIEKRVKELSGTAVPLPYEVYCVYEIPKIANKKHPDKFIHDLIQILNPELRISQNREFFELYPWEAYDMFSAIAQMHGRVDKLHRNEDNHFGANTQEDSEYSVDALFPLGTVTYLLYDKIKKIVLSLDTNLKESPTRNYISYKLEKSNVIALWPKNGWVELILSAKAGQLNDDNNLTYDISNRRWPAQQYALKFYEDTDINAVTDLIQQTYNLKKNNQ